MFNPFLQHGFRLTAKAAGQLHSGFGYNPVGRDPLLMALDNP